MTSILLVDDHHIIVSTLALQIAEYWPSVKVRSESTLATGVVALKAEHFDLAVLDLTLPDAVGVENIHSLKRIAPRLEIVVFTGLVQPNLEQMCLNAGAYAFVTKAEHRDKLVKALSRRLGSADPGVGVGNSSELTVRQRQILRCLLKGQSVKEISGELGISESTVQTHVRAINQMGGCRNRVDLVRWANSLGFHAGPLIKH
jgi:two-component system, NarL family, nitrate/nitrite response regulator NarL